MTTRAVDLDAADPLASYRSLFLGAEWPLAYFDGNSLGRPLRSTGPQLAEFVEHEWGGRLIRGWDERWWDLPLEVGDQIGRVTLGAAPGQTVVGDSTTVLLYKALRAAVAARPGRTEIVLDRENFPTDRYVAEGVAAETGLTVRWLEVDPATGATADLLAGVVGPQTAVVLLSHVAYRSAWIADAAELTRIVHEAGALVVWDLSHSVGLLEVHLDEWRADLAVGCTYKYLNGGPGSPAFLYAASRLLPELSQPIHGWTGNVDPFLMGPDFVPAPGVRSFLSGTPAVIGMLPVQGMLELLDKVGMGAVREKSVALTAFAIEVAAEVLGPLGVTLATTADPAQRGGHITLEHPRMQEATAILWRGDVIPDYRDPGGLRIGLSPLSTSFDEVEWGLHSVRDVLGGLPG